MADVTIAKQVLTKTGVAPTYQTLNATDIYYVLNDTERIVLFFKNTNAGAATITFDVTKTVDGLTIADHTISVPATTGERVAGAFPATLEVESGTHAGKIKFTCDLATGVSVAVLAT